MMFLKSINGCMRTLSVPLVYRMSSSLSSVLQVSYFGKACSSEPEHLSKMSVPCFWEEKGSAYAKHDRIGNESFERDTHAVGGCFEQAKGCSD